MLTIGFPLLTVTVQPVSLGLLPVIFGLITAHGVPEILKEMWVGGVCLLVG